jgi:hypothetical protein
MSASLTSYIVHCFGLDPVFLAPLLIENWATGLCAMFLKILWAKSRNLVSTSNVCFSITAATVCGFHSYLSSVCCLKMMSIPKWLKAELVCAATGKKF